MFYLCWGKWEWLSFIYVNDNHYRCIMYHWTMHDAVVLQCWCASVLLWLCTMVVQYCGITVYDSDRCYHSLCMMRMIIDIIWEWLSSINDNYYRYHWSMRLRMITVIVLNGRWDEVNDNHSQSQGALSLRGLGAPLAGYFQHPEIRDNVLSVNYLVCSGNGPSSWHSVSTPPDFQRPSTWPEAPSYLRAGNR